MIPSRLRESSDYDMAILTRDRSWAMYLPGNLSLPTFTTIIPSEYVKRD